MAAERTGIHDWEGYYQDNEVTEMPWYSPSLDSDIETGLKELKITGGMALDIGSGPGTQAMELARRGFKVTGLDLSKTAVIKAARLAESTHLPVAFVSGNILKDTIDGVFDLLLDRGCFHVLAIEERGVYLDTVYRLLNTGGHLFLKCFSYKEPGTEGPARLRPEEITTLFAGKFEILSMIDTQFIGNRTPHPLALFTKMRKI